MRKDVGKAVIEVQQKGLRLLKNLTLRLHPLARVTKNNPLIEVLTKRPKAKIASS